MDGFIEERARKLKTTKTSALGALLFCGLFLTILGIGALVLVYVLTAEDRRLDFILQGLVFSLVPLLPGVFLLFLYVKNYRKKQAIKNDPHVAVTAYGVHGDKEGAIRGFNEEYALGKVRYETYDNLVSAQGFWLTDNYALSDMGSTLELGRLDSVVWVYFSKNVIIINNQSFEAWNYLLFFEGDGKKPGIMMLPCTKKTYKEAAPVLESYGFTISTDKKLHELAVTNWQKFKRKHLTADV